ncbi:MAG TPA: pantoate--beta-alanine ligase [Acidimicrobiales bacterium]|nr:pantoate--beta-alanine ligase [Acidimicrobiales bacterium]
MQSVRFIGPGRAGRSLAQALGSAGWDVVGLLGRDDDQTDAASGVDVLVIATPDDAIGAVAASVRPNPRCVVVHLAASLGLGVLDTHPRRGAMHPLVPLPTPEIGARRLVQGISFAVAGDPAVCRMVESLGGRALHVADADRAAYHAAACIAANHVVALLGQVGRVAGTVGLELDAFLDLSRAALDDVGRLGPMQALTGPAGRGDWATLERHRQALAPEERPAYNVLVGQALRLAADAAGRTGRDAGLRPIEPALVPDVPAAPSVAVTETLEGLSASLEAARARGARVGFVPTMGALHAGHVSLIERAAAECDVVAVSIYVNPLQFGDPSDLERYPRDLSGDLVVCAQAGADIVFAPSVHEMCPTWPAPTETLVSVGVEARDWEGASRPGHFTGVATVVAKLFAAAGRCRAYFGEKDFQQLAVIRRMAADLGFPVEVVACTTVREADGLALSSRNRRLSPAERAAATALSRALAAGRAAISAGERRPAAVASVMEAVAAAVPEVGLDYATVVDAEDLVVPARLDGHRPLRLLIAAQVGPVRLIDNCAAVVPLRADLASPVGFGLGRQAFNAGNDVVDSLAALAYPVGAVER